jgi:phosphopantetheinyl transferase
MVRFAAPAPHTSAAFADSSGLLGTEERSRAERFVHDRDVELHVTAHALARRALAEQHPPHQPSDWALDADEDGRPIARGPARVDVSISHTTGLVGVAVFDAPYGRCCLDVEQVRSVPPGVAASVLTDAELVSRVFNSFL